MGADTTPDPRGQAVEVAAQRLAARTPPDKHGQLCPIWTRRAKSPPITACDCWVLADSRTDAKVVVLAVWSSAQKAALDAATETLRGATTVTRRQERRHRARGDLACASLVASLRDEANSPSVNAPREK